ncbi:MAG: alpha/beta fold hydrolase [Actinomycetota bacterium]
MGPPPPIRVLGAIEVAGRDGGRAIGSRQHVLVAVLAANAGSVVPADVIAEAIWGDDLPADRSGALHTLVSRLRPRLPEGALQTRAPGYLLADDADVLDVVRFEELLRSAPILPAEGALPLLEEATALWRGPAFGSAADRTAVHHRAIELDELRVVARERRAEALLDLGQAAEAVVALEALLAEHPLREHSVGLAMEALARAGRRSESLRRYSTYREQLAHETGLEPTAELRRTEQAVLSGEIGTVAPAPTEPSGAPLRLRVQTVERRPGELVASAAFGSGPPLLFLPGWISSLDAIGDRSDPRAALVARLAEDFTVTMYDRYGTGLSSAADVDVSLDASVDEVRALLGVVGDDVTLFASSCAGPSALIAAAGTPAVGRLVLMCTYACGPQLFTNAAVRESLVDLVERSWGMGSRVIADLIVPGIDAVTLSVFARFQRRAARPEVAAGYLRQLYEADASGVLADVRQPSLVLHYRDDPAIPSAGSHQLAVGLPDAELVTLEGPYHTPPGGDVERIAHRIAAFAATP